MVGDVDIHHNLAEAGVSSEKPEQQQQKPQIPPRQQQQQQSQEQQQQQQPPPLTSDPTALSQSSSGLLPAQPVQLHSHPSIPPTSPLEHDNWDERLPASDHVRFFRETRWVASRLGPLSSWSTALRLHVFTLMADSRPSVLYWGPDKVAIYNAAFVPLAGKTHPRLMSTTFEENFPEIWDTIKMVFNMAEQSGAAADVNEIPLFVERNHFVEEAFFTGNFNPVRGNSGLVEGFYNSVHEVTKVKIGNRRRAMINQMQIPSGLQRGKLVDHVLPFLELNASDVPMALLYEVDEDTVPGVTQVLLRGRIGVPEKHPLAVDCSNLNSAEGIMPLLRDSQTGIVTVLADGRFDGIEWHGFGEASSYISIMCLSGSGRLFGFLVVGTNPRRPVEEDHLQFMLDLSSKVSSIAASLVTADEIRRRAERLERELRDSERQIRYMAQHASVGMQHLSIDGTTKWANDQYYNLTGHPQDARSQYKLSFIDVCIEEDQPKALLAWKRLLEGEPNSSIELRLKKMFIPPSGEPEHACMLSLSFPYTEGGRVKSIMTCNTDISKLKWAEASEARNAADAREAKRQQEEFIDLVSHELRNPLSAIFQLADTIITSFPGSDGSGRPEVALSEALRSNIEAANTILMCAKHQKRIVDDVLTLSKLEYMMLSISPRAVQLPSLIERCLKMFEADMSSFDIKSSASADPSLKKHNVDWVLCDPSRVTQIFINLLTNAIKFTKTEEKREINVTYGASVTEPRGAFPPSLNWAPSQKLTDDLTLHHEWGLGQPLYLTVTVTDTGVGMTLEKIKKLFSRFEQGSARTTIKYGGSGLGLFISQRLTEKQGGEIGVVSEPGVGSTFGFYVKARRTEDDLLPPPPSNFRPTALVRSKTSPLHGQKMDLDKIHVLLVEDNIVNQRVLRRQLTTAGCVVHVANHGVEALELLRGSDLWHVKVDNPKPVDIILMDWEMPIMDGLTCSREIRALQKVDKIVRHVQIIATTANAREEQIQSALASGIDCVISKPFMVADVLALMRERLSMPSPQVGRNRKQMTP